jgi:hypothetical protein
MGFCELQGYRLLFGVGDLEFDCRLDAGDAASRVENDVLTTILV